MKGDYTKPQLVVFDNSNKIVNPNRITYIDIFRDEEGAITGLCIYFAGETFILIHNPEDIKAYMTHIGMPDL